MKLPVLAAAIVLASSAAAAQPAQMPPLPKLFAGYTQHDVTPGLCRNVSPKQTQCIFPEMTAGRYMIEVSGTSTATAANAAQAIQIAVGNAVCGGGLRRNTQPLVVGKPSTLKLACETTIVTDTTLAVTAVYDDANATKDPKGPTLAIRRLPWTGIVTDKLIVPQ
ncbi:MAG TPA: hypothetical protein VG939_21095 [Caulobacteraceae bacterium]|nr:hypothetical protein [Caulobacteraceae bacterium]